MSLATKYRPQVLEDLIGQRAVVETIRGMLLADRINQTLLVFGPWGSGKTSTARLIARYLNCTAPDRQRISPPCDQCVACKHGKDVEEVNAASIGGIDTIRGLINQAQFSPSGGGRYRIFVLDEAHQLTKQAVQALLKITEEPPKNSLFVLCTTDPQRFPPALSSRCVKLNIKPVAPADTVKILARIVTGENLDRTIFNDSILMSIAEAVRGHPRDAIMTLEQVIARTEQASPSGDTIVDLSDLVLRIVTEEAGERPEAQVVQYLHSIYSGKYTAAILALQKIEHFPAFMDMVVQYHAHTLYHVFSRKLEHDDFSGWYRTIDNIWTKGTVPIDRLVSMSDLFVQANARTHNYAADTYYDLLNVTLQAAKLMFKEKAPTP